jgi:ADP-ribose pyrophosphatase
MDDTTKPEIETTSSTVVYRNRWMLLREDAIVYADGRPGVYGVVEKNDFAVVAAVGDGKIHLVEQYRYAVGQRFWELPQGAAYDPSIDPLTLAHAELREETGLVAGSMVHAGRLFQGYGYSTQAYDVYLATALEQGPVQREAEEQGMVTQAFDLAVFEAMLKDGTIRDASTLAAFALLRLKGML